MKTGAITIAWGDPWERLGAGVLRSFERAHPGAKTRLVSDKEALAVSSPAGCTLARAAMLDFLPDCDAVVYLDSDLVVERPLPIDPQKGEILVARDMGMSTLEGCESARLLKRGDYCNVGVIVAFRTQGAMAFLREWLRIGRDGAKRCFVDQTSFNELIACAQISAERRHVTWGETVIGFLEMRDNWLCGIVPPPPTARVVHWAGVPDEKRVPEIEQRLRELGCL